MHALLVGDQLCTTPLKILLLSIFYLFVDGCSIANSLTSFMHKTEWALTGCEKTSTLLPQLLLKGACVHMANAPHHCQCIQLNIIAGRMTHSLGEVFYQYLNAFKRAARDVYIYVGSCCSHWLICMADFKNTFEVLVNQTL